MASRMKEDEKNERIIRGLLKLPANRRCIDCNNLGPQYVCTNFWTFICTNCSGVHREFTHRVKSVSMAKFTSQEVVALQGGGNERAKEIYFKEWDPQRNSFPDSSNIDRLRDFIKHVYVDRRYTGERNLDKPPRAKPGDREDSNENRRTDSYRGGSRSPPYDDRYSDQAGFGGRNESRSPGYDRGDKKRSPGYFEVVDERRREDRFGNGNQNLRFEDRRLSDGMPKPQGRSPNHQKDVDASSPPMVRPVRDILGNDTPALRIGDPPKSNGTRTANSPAQTQRTLSSSSMGSSDGTSVQLKTVDFGSLIDFNADPEPSVSAAQQQPVLQQTTSPTANASDWASFDMSGQQKATDASTLEFALAQLSGPGPVSGGNMSTLHAGGADSFPKTDGGGTTMQPQQNSLFPAAINHFTDPQINVPIAGTTNQSWGSSVSPNLQALFTAPAGHPPQVAANPSQERSAEVLSHPPPESKPSGRKEIPEDLFTYMHPTVPTPAPGWQRGQHLGMGYAMQYPTALPTFPQPRTSNNPFDFFNEPSSVQAPTFPAMASLQGALPQLDLSRTSSFGSPSPRWMPPQQTPYPSGPYMMQQTPMSQQLYNNPMTMMHHGFGGPQIEGTAFVPSGMDQQSVARYTRPGAPNSFGQVGGNPFG